VGLKKAGGKMPQPRLRLAPVGLKKAGGRMPPPRFAYRASIGGTGMSSFGPV
jgi:hypothetical protein